MTVDYRIGNAEMHNYDGKWSVKVKDEELDEAPAFPGAVLSAHANFISIPYAATTLFSRGFTAFMTAVNPDNYDCATLALTHAHLDAIKKAVEDFKTYCPDAVPAFDELPHNGTLARLMIFKWWIEWALENCERPAIQIS